MTGGGKSSALDRREVAAYAIHLGDGGAGSEQRPADRLLVLERDALTRQRQQRRAAARDQADHQVVGAELAHEVEHPAGRRQGRQRRAGCAASTISMRSQGTA